MSFFNEVPKFHFSLIVEEGGGGSIVVEVVPWAGGIFAEDVDRTICTLGNEVLVEIDAANVDWLIYHGGEELGLHLGGNKTVNKDDVSRSQVLLILSKTGSD